MKKFLPTKKTAEAVLGKLFSEADLEVLAKETQVVVCVGMPGSGKTTIVEMLVAAFGYWRFSSDQIRVGELFPHQEHRLARAHNKVMEARKVVYQELRQRTIRAIEQGQKIVIDATNMDGQRNILIKGLLKSLTPEKLALIVVKTPETIMRRRFKAEGEEGAAKWWSVYQFWKHYLKIGKARYPKKADFPGVHLIKVRRYDLETFDWVLNIGVIVWDVDGTLYQDVPELKKLTDEFMINQVAKRLKGSRQVAETAFWQRYEELKSKTKVLESFGIDGRLVMQCFTRRFPYTKYLKKDDRLKRLLQRLAQFHHVLLTNSGRLETRRKLRALGLPERFFSEIFVTYELPYLKPDRRVFEHIIKQTSFSPQQHLYVGDREATDIVPAKAVGMRTAMVWDKSQVADVSFGKVYGVGRLFGVEV